MDKVTFQAYSDFTAQSRTVAALMSMYANLERQTDVRVELTPIVVFIAFSIESYLNSIGARKIEIWDELERLSWKKKVSILHKTAKKHADWGQDPLQFCTEVFKLRDKLAHGKPERVVGPAVADHREAHQLAITGELQPDWYRSITREWVMEGKERFRLLMLYLGDLYGFHESDHLLSSTGGVLRLDGEDA